MRTIPRLNRLRGFAVIGWLLLVSMACQRIPTQLTDPLDSTPETAPNPELTFPETPQPRSEPTPKFHPKDIGRGGWGHHSYYGRMYDPNTVETLGGEVVSIDSFTPMAGMSGGVHLLLKTGNETLSVHLGPSWYLDNQNLTLEPNNTLEIKGSRITFAEESVLIAAQVKKGDSNWILRDKSGIPAWSGRHRQSLQLKIKN